MDKRTVLILLALGVIGGSIAASAKRQHALKKARALRRSYRPNFNDGCYLVKITDGPAWAIGEYGTFEAEHDRILIEGEEFDAHQFEFILA